MVKLIMVFFIYHENECYKFLHGIDCIKIYNYKILVHLYVLVLYDYIPGSYAPSSKKNLRSTAKSPPAITGVLHDSDRFITL